STPGGGIVQPTTTPTCTRMARATAPSWTGRRVLLVGEVFLGRSRPDRHALGRLRLGDEHLRRAGQPDAVLRECPEEELAELPTGGPLLGCPDRAQDLQRDSALLDRLDPLDPGRLEDPPLPDRVGGHLLSE